MYNSKKPNEMQLFLLKECYTLAALAEANSAARSILRSRSNKISFPDGYIPEGSNTGLPNSVQQKVSAIISALSMESSAFASNGSFGLQHELSSLPDCGDKEFILALLALRGGRNESQRIDALRHLSRALSYSPGDPRYIALAEILEQVKR